MMMKSETEREYTGRGREREGGVRERETEERRERGEGETERESTLVERKGERGEGDRQRQIDRLFLCVNTDSEIDEGKSFSYPTAIFLMLSKPRPSMRSITALSACGSGLVKEISACIV